MAYQIQSMIAFYEVLENLGERQLEVLKAIKKLQPCNNLQISQYLMLPINSVTPRCLELRDKGIVRLHHTGACPYTGRSSRFYSIKDNLNQVLTEQ
jgi:hypothetical protein